MDGFTSLWLTGWKVFQFMSIGDSYCCGEEAVGKARGFCGNWPEVPAWGETLERRKVWVCCCSCCPLLAPSLKEISKNAVFVEGTIGTTDICQGQLGEYIKKLQCQIKTKQLLNSISPDHCPFTLYMEWALRLQYIMNACLKFASHNIHKTNIWKTSLHSSYCLLLLLLLTGAQAIC